MSKLVNDLIRDGYLKADLVIDAFSEINREEFVPENLVSAAEANVPLPIGNGQTISQPLTVAFMLELLGAARGDNVLDVGSGSGWTTGLLSYIVGAKGHVTALERIHALAEMTKENIAKYPFIVRDHIADVVCKDAFDGYKERAPYDRILVSASVEEIPAPLKEQLKVDGTMVIPVRNAIWFLRKKDDGTFEKEEYPGFSFVPFVHVS